MPNVVQVTDSNYEQVVAQAELPVVLAIGASWCIDCRRIQPFFMQFSDMFAGKAVFASCDYDANPGMNERFGVSHIPTLVCIKGGKVVDTLIEPKSVAPFKAFIERNLAGN